MQNFEGDKGKGIIELFFSNFVYDFALCFLPLCDSICQIV
jgi:hypothetical protein